MVGYLQRMAIEYDIDLVSGVPQRLLEEPSFRESAALGTYGVELLRRLNGESSGVATLVLWRIFAWEPEGSPRAKFQLSADLILMGEEECLSKLRAAQKRAV